jgi:SPP1 family phage portal protein
VDDKEVEHFDIYTDKQIYLAEKSTATDWIVKPEANLLGKIPVIYYSQAAPEWNDVQILIDRKEKLHSNHGDTNDYFGSPMVFVQGNIVGFAKKGEQGKVLQGENGATAQYLSWDQSPESVKLESATLEDFIYYMTGTPKISFDNLKSIGPVSGIALKLMFMDAHMHASDKEETFGKGIQRRINFLKAALVKINAALESAVTMTIKPKFEYYLPKNVDEMVNTLMTATAGKQIMSVESAVDQVSEIYGLDPATEQERLQNDESTSLTLPPEGQ